jgi:hypothetical protein
VVGFIGFEAMMMNKRVRFERILEPREVFVHHEAMQKPLGERVVDDVQDEETECDLIGHGDVEVESKNGSGVIVI